LLTLADYETPIFLPQQLRDGPAGAWLRFHCGAAIVDAPGGRPSRSSTARATPAARRLQSRPRPVPRSFHHGARAMRRAHRRPGRHPERPRHAGSRNIAPQGLRPGFWAEVAANAELYPLGVDLMLSHAATP
jgi:alpha-D-ribose 1-methylphosphonate 5-triphosphate synthase subunit PhnH